MERTHGAQWVLILVLVVSLGGANSASAQLSEVDLVVGSGDAKVTLDAATGLYWLDVPETVNLSVTDILAGSGGWTTTGWRYATLNEICDLFAAYALAVMTCGGNLAASTPGDVVSTLQGFLGLTIDTATNRSTSGFYDDLVDPTRVGLGRLSYDIPADLSVSLVQSSATPVASLPSVGNWLVSDTPVPVPLCPVRKDGRPADPSHGARCFRRLETRRRWVEAGPRRL